MASFAACVHEAGHAVAHLATNACLANADSYIVHVSVAGKPRCRVMQREGRPRWPDAIRCLAGPAAEWRHHFGPGWQPQPADIAAAAADSTSRVDVEMASQAIAALPDATLVDAWTEAAALVTREWPAVVRVAEALQERGELSGDAAAAIWGKSR